VDSLRLFPPEDERLRKSAKYFLATLAPSVPRIFK